MKSSMSVRFELFVRDMDAAIDFYTGVLDFDLVREDPAYSSLRRGGVILVLAPVSKLPDSGGYFTRDIAGLRRGLGVEIVLETDGLDAAHARILASGHPVSGPLRERSWGLKDFRVVDPDGFRGLRLAYGPFPCTSRLTCRRRLLRLASIRAGLRRAMQRPPERSFSPRVSYPCSR